jgi:hypothetical protein
MAKQYHLAVICHGLWGTQAHVDMVAKLLREKGEAQSNTSSDDAVELVVVCVSCNEGANTYDGIDFCAERAVEEIDSQIKLLEKSEGSKVESKVTRFSIVGYRIIYLCAICESHSLNAPLHIRYSLGGLIARFALGILWSRGFFDRVKPCTFATFASPAIGIPRYRGTWSAFTGLVGSRLLSRSGAQMYARDRFHDGKPLLELMSEHGTSFRNALEAFERVEVYANAVMDRSVCFSLFTCDLVILTTFFVNRTVPFPSAAIVAHDPFAYARHKAAKRNHLDVSDPDAEIDLRDGGLEVVCYPEYASLISELRIVDPPPPSDSTESKSGPRGRKRRWRLKLCVPHTQKTPSWRMF